jgi:transcription elongation factor GreA
MGDRYYFLRDGIERLHLRLTAAKAAHKAACDLTPEAREAGDSSVWHDNFAFEDNQRQIHQLARRVRDLEAVLHSSTVVERPRGQPAEVVLGARLTYRYEDDAVLRTCELASYDDGDAQAGRVSYNSPLGRHLLGTRAGDQLEVMTGGRRRTLEVVAIHAEEVSCPAN